MAMMLGIVNVPPNHLQVSHEVIPMVTGLVMSPSGLRWGAVLRSRPHLQLGGHCPLVIPGALLMVQSQ